MPLRILILAILAMAGLYGQNPITPVYPGALSTDAETLCWKNGGATTLGSNINSATLTVPVASATNFCAPVIVTIGNERMKVCSIVGNTLNICADGRGVDGSTAASHTSGAAVSAFVPAYWLNRISAEINAVQSALGVNLTNVLSDPNQAGVIVRRANGPVVARTLQGTPNQIVITNPAGDGGAPIFSLPATINVNTSGTAQQAHTLSTGAVLQAPTWLPYTVATLPAGAVPGRIAIVTDGAHGKDCLVGGGSYTVVCYQRTASPGADWVVFAGEDALRNLVHATDCTSIVSAGLSPWPRVGDICIELDDETLYSCQPGSGSTCTVSGDWIQISGSGGGGGGDVTAAASFGADNSIIRAEGTGKGVQSSDCSIDDSGNMACDGSITAGGSGNTLATVEGSTVDANETVVQVEDPTADRTITIPDASGKVVLDIHTQTLTNKTLTSPTIETPTVSGAVAGSGTHYYDFPEISAPSNPSADIARVYAKTGSTTQFCMKDSAGVETCFGSGGGGGAPAYLFEFALGGTNGINGWGHANIMEGFSCEVCSIGGGTSMHNSSLTLQDVDAEIAYLRVGRIKTGVDLENLTIQIEGASDNDTDTGTIEVEVSFACPAAEHNLNQAPSTLSWGSTANVTVTKSTSTAIALLMLSASGHDISGTCSTGDFLFVKFELDDDTSVTGFRMFSGRAYSP